jgi:hypothetical protein
MWPWNIHLFVSAKSCIFFGDFPKKTISINGGFLKWRYPLIAFIIHGWNFHEINHPAMKGYPHD